MFLINLFIQIYFGMMVNKDTNRHYVNMQQEY